MKNKGQMNMSVIILMFITVLVGLIFVPIIAQNVGVSTNTVTLANKTFTSAAEGASVYLTDYKAVSGVVIYNNTVVVPAANYTVTNNVVYNGALATKITTAAENSYAGEVWKISGTAQPTTYISDSGGRAIAGLIVIMFALAVLTVVVYPVMKNKFE